MFTYILVKLCKHCNVRYIFMSGSETVRQFGVKNSL